MDKRETREEWTIRRLREKPPCKTVTKSACVPLRGDSMCGHCYEIELELFEKEGKK